MSNDLINGGARTESKALTPVPSARSSQRPAQRVGALVRQARWKALRTETALGLEQTRPLEASDPLEIEAVTQPFPPPRTISAPFSPEQAGIQGERQRRPGQGKPAVHIQGI